MLNNLLKVRYVADMDLKPGTLWLKPILLTTGLN